MSRIVGQSAAVQAAVRRHYYQRPRSSRIITPPIPPVIEVTLVAYTVQSADGWHLPGDHDDPVMLITEGAVIGLFLVVIVVGFWISIGYVRRPI